MEAYLRIGPLLSELGYNDEAELVMKQALALEHSSAAAMRELAAFYGNTGRWDESILYFEKALKLNPSDKKLAEDLKSAINLRESSKTNP
jgi:tetratricopeptide (TPR) repeat protein